MTECLGKLDGLTDADSGKVSVGGSTVNTTNGALSTHDATTLSKLESLIDAIKNGGERHGSADLDALG